MPAASDPSGLAPYAMPVSASAGRRHPEPPHPYRTDYQRDRDRILHSRAFRRLEAKTQVFTKRYSDHFRNRLTHTLEVAQITRTVAGVLGLNGDLAEALALVHDIGHPPFGHAGEHALDELMRQHGPPSAGFDHNLHALRIVECFEQRYAAFPGLNLTFEVREGIIKHSREYELGKYPELAQYRLECWPPLEAQLINLADEIAYNTADLDDGYEAKLLDREMIVENVALYREIETSMRQRYPQASEKMLFNETLKRMIDAPVTDLIENTARAIRDAGVETVEDVRRYPRRLVAFSVERAEANAALKRFLFSHLYSAPRLLEERDRAVRQLRELFCHYVEHPQRLPANYQAQIGSEPAFRVVCDYIARMTDGYLLRQHKKEFAAIGTGPR